MRPTFIAFLLLSLIVPSSLHAALTWTKQSYRAPAQVVFRGDFTGDGFDDLLLSDGESVSILPNAGNGTFDVSRLYTLSFANQLPSFRDFTLLDFNRDNKLDFAACGDAGVQIFQGNGDGTMVLVKTLPDFCNWVTSADFNRDGNPDLAVGSSQGNKVTVYFGDGQGGISSTVVNENINFTSDDGNPCMVDGSGRAADLTGDKVADLAITVDCFNGTASASALLVGKGNGTGHFTFHKDQEINFDARMRMTIGDGNKDNLPDIIATAHGDGPHASSWGSLLLFTGKGDGTFNAVKEVISASAYAGSGTYLMAATMADFNGDEIKDGMAVINTTDPEDHSSYSLQFAIGQADGTYAQFTATSLGSGAFDMIGGDFNKDARADLALVRQGGDDVDVWLNTGPSSINCAQPSAPRSLTLCSFPAETGKFIFVGNPLDNVQIDAMQIYVDGKLTFETPDDLLGAELALDAGQHRITAKAWDALGSFSSTTTVTSFAPCANTTNRTVKICAPQDGSRVSGQFKLLASAVTNLKFNSVQVYVDGKLTFSDTHKSVDMPMNLAAGTHHITVKAWDSSGSFSSAVNVTVR